MTSAIPVWIDWPALCCLVLILGVRLRWFASTRLDTYFNVTLCLMAMTRLLSEPAADRWIADHTPLHVTTVQQLALCLVPSQSAEFMGVVLLLAGVPVAQVSRRVRAHRVIAILLAVTIFVAATRARQHEMRLESATGWDEVIAWLAFCIMPALLAVSLIRLMAGDLSRRRRDTAHLVVLAELTIVVAIAGGSTVSSFLLAVAEQLDLAHTVAYRLESHSRVYLLIMLVNMGLAGGPCLRALATRAHLDGKGRRWRKLRPLWADLTAALPDAVLSTERPRRRRPVTDFHLHRTAVEIRDVVLFLHPYLEYPCDSELAAMRGVKAVGGADERIAAHALALARALAHVQRAHPSKPRATASPLRSPSCTLDDELTELLGIAAWWSKAKDVAALKAPALASTAG